MSKNRFKITINNKGKLSSHEVNGDTCIIGRGREVHIFCEHDLLSRNHLKIFKEKNTVMVEEMGSTNGSWLNDKKLVAGKPEIYHSEDNLVLGGQNGAIVYINAETLVAPVSAQAKIPENIPEIKTVIKAAVKPTATTLSNPDKTLNFDLNNLLKKEMPAASDKTEVTKVVAKEKNKVLAMTNMKSIPENDFEKNVEDDFVELEELKVANGTSTLISHRPPTAKTNQTAPPPIQKKKATHLKEVKAAPPGPSLDNKVKQFISTESLKLKENSLKKAQQIKKHAIEEENQIIKNAHLKEKDIIEKAKILEKNILETARNREKEIIESAKAIEKDILDTVRAIEKEILDNVQSKEKEILDRANQDIDSRKKDLEELVKRSHEKISLEEKELTELRSKHDRIVSDFDEKLSNLKDSEYKHNQKLKLLTEEVDSLKERIKNETQNLEEVKGYHQTIKRSSDLKLEELAIEERKMKAKIETEFYEAQGKTAKMFAEAEKAVATKESLQPEIQDLKKEKNNIEKEINKLDINCKKLQFESEKLEQHFSNQKQEIEKAGLTLIQVTKEIDAKVEGLKVESESLENEKKSLNELKLSAKKEAEIIVLDAQEQSKQILSEAKEKNQIEIKKIKTSLSEFELKVKQFETESIRQRNDIISNAKLEIEKEKELNREQIEKLLQQKNNIQDEIKWTLENAKTKADEHLSAANKKAEEIINEAKKETVLMQNQAKETIIMATNQTKLDIQKKKEQLVTNIEKMKETMMNEVNAHHQKNMEEVQTLKNQLNLEKEKVKADNEFVQKLKANLENSIKRSDNLLNENYVQAEIKIQDMISKAQKRVKDIDSEAQRNKERYQSELAEYKRNEEEKIEEMKTNVENYAEKKHHEMAESYAVIAQEYITLELVKSLNSTVNEKLIKKLGDLFKKVVYEAVQGEIERKNVNMKTLFPRRKINFKAIGKNLLVIAFLGSFAYSVIYYPHLYTPVIKEIRLQAKEAGIELPF